MDILQEIRQMITEKMAFKNAAILDLGNKERLRQIKEARMHGTTILALKCKDGVIIAGDRRCVAGNTIFSDEMLKIEKISELSCLAGAGWVSDFQALAEILRDNMIPYFEKFWETEIFVDGQANLLKYAMRNSLFLVWPILAGWDPNQEAGRIFFFEPSGTTYELPYFISTGSGEREAHRILKSKWSKDMSQKRGVELSVEAILASSEVDPNTSSPLLSAPIVKIINPRGIIDASGKMNYSFAWKKHLKTLALRGEKPEFVRLLAETKTQNRSRAKKNKNGEEK